MDNMIIEAFALFSVADCCLFLDSIDPHHASLLLFVSFSNIGKNGVDSLQMST